jgi:hypothetical protein
MSASLGRLGQIRGTGATDAIFLKIGQSDILNAFQRKTVFKGLVRSRTIQHGKSFDFQVTGRSTAGYVTPGTPLLGGLNSPSDLNVRNVPIDGLLAADQAIFDLDQLMNYADVASELWDQLGQALAWETDARLARIIFAGANNTSEPLSTGKNVGRIGYKKTLSAGYASASKTAKGDELVSAIGDAVVAMRKKHVDTSQLVAVFPPDEYDFLNESSRAINGDFNQGIVNGTTANGMVLKIKGVPVTWSNQVTQAAYTNVTGDNNSDYAQDLSKCRGLLFTREAVALLQLRAPKLQITASGGDFNIQYQSTLAVATQSIGCGRLRDECAAAIVIP